MYKKKKKKKKKKIIVKIFYSRFWINFLQFSNCICMSNTSIPTGERNIASVGYCDLGCGNFTWYILLFSLFVFVHSTSEVGSMLLILRCVDPTDKAMALGLIQFAIGLFGKLFLISTCSGLCLNLKKDFMYN